jgi:hypothetical protein
MTEATDNRHPIRAMRIPSDLWEAAKVKAAENDESVARVVRRALREYVQNDDTGSDQ